MVDQISIRHKYKRQSSSKNLDSSIQSISSKRGLKDPKLNGFRVDDSIRADINGNAYNLTTDSRAEISPKRI